jgi:hypothetical protein
MQIQSKPGSLRPEQIARLLRHAIDQEATAKDRAGALRHLLDARERMSYDDFGLAVKGIAAKNKKEQEALKHCVRKLFL